MTSVMRNLILALPMAAVLAACGNAPIVLSEGRISLKIEKPVSVQTVPRITMTNSAEVR